MKANWSCTACGMCSGRRYCVQRHIDNNNIHKGKANAIPFVEYLVGRREGLYPPNARPSFGSKKRTIVEKTEDEIENMYARRAAETALQFTPVGDYAYLPIITEVANNTKSDSLSRL
jgi:Fe-S oxidoreductase